MGFIYRLKHLRRFIPLASAGCPKSLQAKAKARRQYKPILVTIIKQQEVNTKLAFDTASVFDKASKKHI
jgi:hypothetical protein